MDDVLEHSLYNTSMVSIFHQSTIWVNYKYKLKMSNTYDMVYLYNCALYDLGSKWGWRLLYDAHIQNVDTQQIVV